MPIVGGFGPDFSDATPTVVAVSKREPVVYLLCDENYNWRVSDELVTLGVTYGRSCPASRKEDALKFVEGIQGKQSHEIAYGKRAMGEFTKNL